MTQAILAVDKPEGMTSRAVDNFFQRKFHTRRVGHFGTLDPMSSGLLPVFVGPMTSFISCLPPGPKEYEGLIRFGRETDSGDRDGRAVAEGAVPQGAEEVYAAFRTFLGRQELFPPLYSAIKVKGKPLYDYARKGVEVPIEPRRCEIYAIDRLQYQAPDLTFRLRCSGGTYVRSLAREVGRRLQTAAYLQALRRTESAPFTLDWAQPFEALAAMSAEEILSRAALSVEQVFSRLPQALIKNAFLRRLAKGVVLPPHQYQLVDGRREPQAGDKVWLAVESAERGVALGELVSVGDDEEEEILCLKVLKLL